MTEVSLFRLYVLRATYLLIVVGLGVDVWPELFHHPPTWTLMRGVACCFLSTIALLSLLGLRYPVRMLPLLVFELVWKVTWLVAFGLPAVRTGALDAATQETIKACLLGVVIFPLAIPWPYMYAQYFKHPADRWGRAPRAAIIGAANLRSEG